jgi:YesN/AraC family two-component response regulator
MIRVLICDDQEVVREGLRVILSSAPSLEVVGIAQDGAEALELIPQTTPDLVLMDLKMPGMNGIQALAPARRSYYRRRPTRPRLTAMP